MIRTPEHNRKIGEAIKGEKHGRWLGDGVSYKGLHLWLGRNFGRPSKCSRCGTTEAKRYEWANVSGNYSRDREDYARLCVSCHHLIDDTGHKAWFRRQGVEFVSVREGFNK